MKCYDCKNEAVPGKTRCQKHIELNSLKAKEWRERNKEKAKQSRKDYYEKNKEEVKQKTREWSKNNRERKSIVSAIWAKENQDKVLNSRMKRFGISAFEYNEMLKKQGGKCVICGTTEPGGRGRFNVDHDHEVEKATGKIKIRGLLCVSCNRGLGYMRDSQDILKSAIEYLNNNS
jgi:DNA repair exonuclease SbcCD ATPase subunit